MRPSSKEGGDCIFQALACLRDAPGRVALKWQSEESSAGTSELGRWGTQGGLIKFIRSIVSGPQIKITSKWMQKII